MCKNVLPAYSNIMSTTSAPGYTQFSFGSYSIRFYFSTFKLFLRFSYATSRPSLMFFYFSLSYFRGFLAILSQI